MGREGGKLESSWNPKQQLALSWHRQPIRQKLKEGKERTQITKQEGERQTSLIKEKKKMNWPLLLYIWTRDFFNLCSFLARIIHVVLETLCYQLYRLCQCRQKANVRKITWLTVVIYILKTCKLWLEVGGKEQVNIPVSVALAVLGSWVPWRLMDYTVTEICFSGPTQWRSSNTWTGSRSHSKHHQYDYKPWFMGPIP